MPLANMGARAKAAGFLTLFLCVCMEQEEINQLSRCLFKSFSCHLTALVRTDGSLESGQRSVSVSVYEYNVCQ